MQYQNAIDAFRAAMTEAGIVTTDSITGDGVLHRFHIDGHKSGSRNGAYVLHIDRNPAGWAQDFKSGAIVNWRADGQRGRLSKADWAAIEAAKKQRQAEQQQVHQQAAQKARQIWKRAIYAGLGNEYCCRKKIKPHGTKTGDSGSLKGVLIVPLYNADNKLVNLQFIQPDGTKRFLSGGQKKGCFWALGELTDTILITEGMATGCSLFEHQGLQTVIAFDAGNLEAVAKVIRAKHPNAEIVIAGDNDASGKGQQAARAAALAVGGKYIIPPTPGQDWNDHLTKEGA
ncbi:MAG: toprim domain-containing protein [Methylobacter sp.]